ncbi:hypothetical protein [Virgibacillus necropolis]|uniref:Uncharacterized protein n=1 Tax=Virgibacillus necropolis TaxID=163877 RepID=A0A221MFG4_9BACI|nr:hypothetical protein [Virgibacillus necropolis]ASN06362.1 hypothetical protein CFK40_15710 [Virgibacillus necropolis]
MTHIMDHEQDIIWESIHTLAKIDVDQAKSVLKVAIERSLQQLNILPPIISKLCLTLPSTDDLVELQRIEKSMLAPFFIKKTKGMNY